MEAVKPKKSRKKLFIVLGIIVAVIAVLLTACGMMVNSAKKQMEAAMNAMQTDVVTVRPLTKSIGATGKVISVDLEDVTTTLSNVEIMDIPVEVGDTVEAGQIIVQFDTEDIAENLAIARRALSQTQGQYGISAENARRQVDDAVRGGEYSADVAARSVDTAYKAYLDAWDTLEDAEDAEKTAWKACREAEDELDTATEDLQELMQTEDYDMTEYASLQLKIYQLEQSIPQLESAAEQAGKLTQQAADAIDTLYDQYVAAQKNYENTVASGESTVASAQAAQQSTALSANTDQQQKQVDALSEQLEKGVITAPISGVVTAVNYEGGDLYMQGAILTIQDCSAFEIEAQIGEYDISDIQKGQKVLIKTDATRDQELEGTVVFVSPTATAAASMTGMTTVSTDPTYEIRISVDTHSDRLRLDMSANLSIIIQEVEDALTVPYNAVQTAEDGSTFVEVINADETTTVVPVEVVMESNYYTQISGSLQEGQQVRLVSGETSNMFSVMAGMREGGF